MPIGFIGLGAMGAPLATRLLEAGQELVIHTRRREAAEPFEVLGALWVPSPRDVAARAREIFTMLPGPAEVDAVVFGSDGPSWFVTNPTGAMVTQLALVVLWLATSFWLLGVRPEPDAPEASAGAE